MSKFWQARLNASWKETVSSTVSGLSDGAARLRQNLQVPSDGRAGDAPGASLESDAGRAQQYLRLPVESAKKLRWYDRPDLNNLVQLNLRDKNDLLGVNAALRQVLLAKGISEDDLEAELEEKLLDVDRMHTHDEGVNSVLVASAGAEIDSLRGQIAQQADEIEQLKDRLKSNAATNVSTSTPDQEARQSRAPSRPTQHPASGLPPRYTSPSNSAATPSAASSSAPDLASSSHQGSTEQPQLGAQHGALAAQAASHTTTVLQSPASTATAAANTIDTAATFVHLRLSVSEASSSVQAALVPSTSSVSADSNTLSLEPSAVAASSAARGASSDAETQGSSFEGHTGPDNSAGTDSHDLAELQQALAQERKHTAALIGKLQRLEQERQAHVEQLDAQDATLEDMDKQGRAVQAQADAALQNLKEVSEASERQIAHLRAQAATTSGQHLEALRKAQDICTQAEAKADAADRKLQKAESDLRRAQADLRASERERDAAESRAAAAQVENDKGSAANNASAAAKRASDERESEVRSSLRAAEAKHKQQLAHLDASVLDLQRALTSSHQEVTGLEQRLSKAEQSEGEALRELREAESALVDQQALLLRAAALEDKLKESRAEQGQLHNYKQLTKELEAAKARVEEEVIATVQIATGLESRLQKAKRDADAAQQQAQQADLRANQAEEAVQAEAARRLASIGSDRTSWPAVARDEIVRLEKKQQLEMLQGMSSMLEALQRNLEEEAEGRKAETAARAAAQDRYSASEERFTKLGWESSQAVASLQRKVTLLQQQLEDMRQAAVDAEQERDKLALSQRKTKRSRTSFGSLGPNTPRRGSGSLRGADAFGNDSETPTANGTHRESLESVDIVYLKNVLLKFVDAHAHGRTQECNALLPAIAALLRATPLEYRILKDTLQRSDKTGNWWARAIS